LYDSIVFGLTVNRTLPSIRKKEAGFIVKKLLEDGLLYYRYVSFPYLLFLTPRRSVIFSITFVLTFMIVGQSPSSRLVYHAENHQAPHLELKIFVHSKPSPSITSKFIDAYVPLGWSSCKPKP
jgi:hypothetical protein